jgi:hypothetical protein
VDPSSTVREFSLSFVRAADEFMAANDFSAARRTLAAGAALEPSNPDHLIAVAATHIREEDLPSALSVYDSILHNWPGHVHTLVLRAVYGGLAGRSRQSAADWAHLVARHPVDGLWCQQIHELARRRETMALTDATSALDGPQHAFVVLGHEILDNGDLSRDFIDRLNLTLTAAHRYPGARIIVSGGATDTGQVEAQAMRAWLTERGVSPTRVLVEDRSTDTIENALFSIELTARAGIREVTVVTSAYHSARAAALFDVANEIHRKDDLPQLAAVHHVSAGLPLRDPEPILEMHRDVLRLSGIWEIPTFRR